MSYTLKFESKDGKRNITFTKENANIVSVLFKEEDLFKMEFHISNLDKRFLDIEETYEEIETGGLNEDDPLYVFNAFLSIGFKNEEIESIINLLKDEPVLKTCILDANIMIGIYFHDDRFEHRYVYDGKSYGKGVSLNIEVSTKTWEIVNCDTSIIHDIVFKIDEDYPLTIPISYMCIEDIIYDEAVDFCSETDVEDWFLVDDIPYHIVRSCNERLLQFDNLRRLDFLNTGKFFELSDEEVKKYEGHVAKCEMFGSDNNAELFVKQDGTCMMIY